MRFALITEGITDQAALETLLAGHYDSDDLTVNPLQPQRDATDAARQEGFGGWALVLEYCNNPEALTEALAFNDYLIIQLDTDCGELPNFGLPLHHEGKRRDEADIVAGAIAVIQAKIGADLWARYAGRFLFAISVDALECWLLPLYENRTNPKVTGCWKQLQRICAQQGLGCEKTYSSYEVLSGPLREPHRLKGCAAQSLSLQLFLDSLPAFAP